MQRQCQDPVLRSGRAAHLPADFLDELGRFRTFSTAFKINIACERPPQYRAFDADKCGFDYPSYVHIGPDIEYLERAYDDAKHGWYSSRPFITPVVPTTVDDTLAPPGKHVVNLFGGHAPYELKNATWEHERDNFVAHRAGRDRRLRARLLRRRHRHAGAAAAGHRARSSTCRNGHIFHGELAPDQLFFKRPVAHFADYRTPIRGLYLCGSLGASGRRRVAASRATTPPARSSRTCAGNDAGAIPDEWHRIGSLNCPLIGRKLLSFIELEQLYPGRRSPLAIASDRMLL